MILETLNLVDERVKKVVIVYTQPKVGGTALVNSLRISAAEMYTILHIHDDMQLQRIQPGLTIHEIMDQLKKANKEVRVITITRTPIKRKMSTFFEFLRLHFPGYKDKLEAIPYDLLQRRFIDLFPHIGKRENKLEGIPAEFPTLCLRLEDASTRWSFQLKDFLGVHIFIMKGNETASKPQISGIYQDFQKKYRIPRTHLQEALEEMKECYTEEERRAYEKEWIPRIIENTSTFTTDQYTLYLRLIEENAPPLPIELEHYKDEGCVCELCSRARIKQRMLLTQGKETDGFIIHSQLKQQYDNEIARKREEILSKLNEMMKIVNQQSKKKRRRGGKSMVAV